MNKPVNKVPDDESRFNIEQSIDMQILCVLFEDFLDAIKYSQKEDGENVTPSEVRGLLRRIRDKLNKTPWL